MKTKLITIIATIITRIVFKTKLRSSFETSGGGLIIANHVSLLDAILIRGLFKRDVRFVMHAGIYKHPLLHWLFKALHMIPVESKKGTKYVNEFISHCQSEIKNGHLVCIFPEGQVTRTGFMSNFKSGIEKIQADLSTPVHAVQLANFNGTPLSYKIGTSQRNKFSFRSLKREIQVSLQTFENPKLDAFKMRQKLQEMEAITLDLKFTESDLITTALRSIKKNRNLPFTSIDDQTKTFASFFMDAFATYKNISARAHSRDKIAVVTLNHYHQSVLNFAAVLTGKTLLVGGSDDHTTTLILTHKEVVLHDNNKSGFLDKQLLKLPVKVLRTFFPTTSRPVISDQQSTYGKNILSLSYGLKQVFKTDELDTIINLFPSKSTTGIIYGLWIPLLLGIETRPSIDLTTSSKLSLASTLLLGPQTEVNFIANFTDLNDFFAVYSTDANSFNFRSAITDPKIAPLLTASTESYEIKDIIGASIQLPGTKKGSVGRPIPGLALRVTDEEGNELSANQPGWIEAKGAVIYGECIEWVKTTIYGSICESGFLSLSS